MLHNLFIILHLLSHDLRLPFNLNEPLARSTEQFKPQEIALAPPSTDKLKLPEPAVLPRASTSREKFVIDAERAILVDADSAEVLFEKNADKAMPMASITKLMTALVVLDEAKDLSKTVKIPKSATQLDYDSSQVGLTPGEHMTIRDLLEAMLVHSANDAAIALAEEVGGSRDMFVREMNEYAQRLGMTNSSFANASGLDQEGGAASARDISFLLREVYRHPLIGDFSNIQSDVVYSEEGTPYYLKATDKLLASGIGQVLVAKTGNTDLAGPSFALMAKVDDRDLIGVVLNSADRFGETERLLRYGVQAYDWPGESAEFFGDNSRVRYGG